MLVFKENPPLAYVPWLQAMAEESGDGDKAKVIQDELNELEERAEALDRQRTKNISAIRCSSNTVVRLLPTTRNKWPGCCEDAQCLDCFRCKHEALFKQYSILEYVDPYSDPILFLLSSVQLHQSEEQKLEHCGIRESPCGKFALTGKANGRLACQDLN